MNEEINIKLKSLKKSKFRNSFHLREKDKNYVLSKGYDKIKEHCYDFIEKRLAKAYIENDGRQTPMKGHPVFIAQHATATCCRDCLYKWHHLEKGRELSKEEINMIVELIMTWIKEEMNN